MLFSAAPGSPVHRPPWQASNNAKKIGRPRRGAKALVKDMSTMSPGRPTILAEKRRMQRELGLEVDPEFVMPKGNTRDPSRKSAWQKFAEWMKGAPDE